MSRQEGLAHGQKITFYFPSKRKGGEVSSVFLVHSRRQKNPTCSPSLGPMKMSLSCFAQKQASNISRWASGDAGWIWVQHMCILPSLLCNHYHFTVILCHTGSCSIAADSACKHIAHAYSIFYTVDAYITTYISPYFWNISPCFILPRHGHHISSLFNTPWNNQKSIGFRFHWRCDVLWRCERWLLSGTQNRGWMVPKLSMKKEHRSVAYPGSSNK